MNFRSRTIAAIALVVALPAAYSQLKPGTIPPPEKSASGAPGLVECARDANKALPACMQDKGIARTPPAMEDPAIRRTPPPTGDPIANPRPPAPPEDKKAPR